MILIDHSPRFCDIWKLVTMAIKAGFNFFKPKRQV